eukprot:Pgem_evm1s3697
MICVNLSQMAMIHTQKLVPDNHVVPYKSTQIIKSKKKGRNEKEQKAISDSL